MHHLVSKQGIEGLPPLENDAINTDRTTEHDASLPTLEQMPPPNASVFLNELCSLNEIRLALLRQKHIWCHSRSFFKRSSKRMQGNVDICFRENRSLSITLKRMLPFRTLSYWETNTSINTTQSYSRFSDPTMMFDFLSVRQTHCTTH